jgi:hypothetical protein
LSTNASIESLNVLTTLLDNTVALARITEERPKNRNVEPQDEKHFSTVDVAGLSLLARCIQSAMEHGYSQCGSEIAKAKAEPFKPHHWHFNGS